MEDGAIPANLHYHTPNPDIPGLADGRLSVVSQTTPWNGGYVGINSFGFGGSNVHVVLRSNPRQQRQLSEHPASAQKRLLTFSGRTSEAVEHGLKKMAEHAENVEMQCMLQDSSGTAPASHPYRGYSLLNQDPSLQDVQVLLTQYMLQFLRRYTFMLS